MTRFLMTNVWVTCKTDAEAQFLGFALAVTSPVVPTSLYLDCKSLRFALNRSKKKTNHKPLDTRLCPSSGMLWEPPFKTSSLYLFSSAASDEEGKITPCLNSRPRRVLWVAHLCVSLWMQKRTRPCPLVCAVLLSLDSQGKLLQWSICWWCGPVKVFGGLDQKLRFWDLFSISLLICLTPDESLVHAALMLLIVILLNVEVVL